jgi:hypothetical protein
MKTRRWMVLSAAALAALGFVLARADVARTAGSDPEVRALRRQVEQLQSRLKAVEERLAKVESAKPSVLPRFEVLPRSSNASPMILLPRQRDLPERSGQSPQIWGQGEINGWPFYFIPCGGK